MIDLKQLLSEKENVNIECKHAKSDLPSSVWNSYSSFANTFGGTILLGVKEENRQFIPSGVEDSDKMISDIWNALNNPQKVSSNILFDHHVYAHNLNGVHIVVIDVPRANRQDKPVFVGTDMFKGSFRRNGEGDYHCRKDEVLAMLWDQSDVSVDNRLLENLSRSDLNAESIRRYKILFANIRPNHV